MLAGGRVLMYADLITAFRTQISAVWTEVVPNGIFLSLDSQVFPIERMCTSNKVPYAVIDIRLQSSNQWGGANLVEQGTVKVYYLCNNSVSTTELIGKLEALRTALFPAPGICPLTTGQ